VTRHDGLRYYANRVLIVLRPVQCKPKLPLVQQRSPNDWKFPETRLQTAGSYSGRYLLSHGYYDISLE